MPRKLEIFYEVIEVFVRWKETNGGRGGALFSITPNGSIIYDKENSQDDPPDWVRERVLEYIRRRKDERKN